MSVEKAVVVCPGCQTGLRFPKGPEKLRLTCPECRRDCIVQRTESSYKVVGNAGLPALVGMVATGKSAEAIKSAQDKVFPDQDGKTRIHVSSSSTWYAKFGRTGLLGVAVAFILLAGISFAALDRRSSRDVLESQKDALQLSWQDVDIIEKQQEPILQLSDNRRIFFAFDDYHLKQSAKYKLNVLSNSLSSRNMVSVFGYADSIGNTDYNKKLSYKRARSVSDYLLAMKSEGMDIEAKGLGEENPIAPNMSAFGRSLNRRVDIIIKAREADTGLWAWVQEITKTVQGSVVVFWLTLLATVITILSFPFMLFPLFEKILVTWLVRKAEKI